MTIQVTGTLVDPVNQPLANAVIRVISLDTTSAVAKSSAKVTVGIDGTYDFNLLNGKYSIEVLQTNTYHKIAYVDITGGSVTPTTLEDMIASDGYCEVEAPTCPV